ncbi:serine/threonine-protein kinase [Actinoplanes sp. CA-252034]|uniref:serine/threonine-protein kinase n=1 Tax=Actinoplanes sp. CA-252034 TaxID=3239906 RepID=UPI003D96E3BA
MLSPGDVLNGRYRLTQRIAAGGMGEVWRGDDLLLHRKIAVKVLLPALMADSDFITRFRSEARMMAALRHPGIVQVYDYGENAQVGAHRLDYLVMEYIDGTPLSARIQRAGRLSPADTMEAVAQVADALQAAHDAGIIHRDVKPANLLVRPAGAIVLVDFGVARSTGVTGITSTNVVLGSAHYMAPEQAEGRPVTAATDMYAVGAVAFCCLTGRPPYVGDNPLAVLAQLVHGQPPVLPPDVPAPVAGVVMRALAKDPGQRFPSAAALAAAARGAAAALSRRGPSVAGGQMPGTAPRGGFGGGPAPSGAFPARPASGAFPRGTATGSFSAGRGAADGAAPHGFVAGSALVGASGTSTGGHGSTAGDVTAASSARRRNVTVALAAAAVVAVLAGVGIILGNQPDEPNLVTGSQSLGGQDAPPSAVTGTDKPRGQGTGRPKSSPKGGATTGNTAPAVDDPVAGPTDTGQHASTDPDEPRDPDATEPATNPHSDPVGICGNGYQVIDSKKLATSAGVLRGTVYLLYRASGGKNCVVTIKADTLDEKTSMSAKLEVQGSAPVADSGTFQYYAGPVTATASKTCVKWSGSIGGLSFTSDFSHCG